MIPRLLARLMVTGSALLGAACSDSTAPSTKADTTFDVELRWVGTSPGGVVSAAFDSAVARISRIIVADLPDARVGTTGDPFDLTDCSESMTGGSKIAEVMDDLVIYVKVEPIDGVGKTLASAGPCATRVTGGLTVLGIMRFDSADLTDLASKGRLNTVVFHEMLHVVGVGTLWGRRGVLADSGLTTVRMTGVLATAACVNDHGGGAVCQGAVPVENCRDLNPPRDCGAGTIDSHWKWSIFKDELMTGYYGGETKSLSKMTLQSLADLGYSVALGSAESYKIPTLAAGRIGVTSLRAVPEDITVLGVPLAPRFTVDANGRLSPIPLR